jgi:hypothetical protein
MSIYGRLWTAAAMVVGIAAGAWCQMPLSSSGLGMGANTAVAQGADAIVWNPAGLFFETGMDWSIGNITIRESTTLGYGDILNNPPTSQTNLLEILRQVGDGENQRVDASGAVMFSIGRVGVAVLGDAAARFGKRAPGGDGTGIAETGSEFSFVLSQARRVGEGLVAGVNLRYIRAKSSRDSGDFTDGVLTLTDSTRAADADWAVDGGLVYDATSSLRLGLMVRNLKRPSFHGIDPEVVGPMVSHQTSVTIGAALHTRRGVLIAADWDNVTGANRISGNLNLGLASALGQNLEVRTGLYDGSWQVGLGVGLGLARLNLAYSPSSESMLSISTTY